METKHTPAPWQWYWREENNESDCGVFWEKSKGQAWSVCRAPRYEKKEQWEANARLIAAAPDLLAVLQEWIYDGRLQTFEDRERFRKAARASINKATGA